MSTTWPIILLWTTGSRAAGIRAGEHDGAAQEHPLLRALPISRELHSGQGEDLMAPVAGMQL